MTENLVPNKDYGILQRCEQGDELDLCIEEVRNKGFSVLSSCINESEQTLFKNKFDSIYSTYADKYSLDYLKKINEENTVRCPLSIDNISMFKLAANEKVLRVIASLIDGRFLLNQQNLIINPPQKGYNQGAWHRDLPYQHFVSSTPLSVNVIYCVDDFTKLNGGSFVLPASHIRSKFPSRDYINKNAVQIEAVAGSFIFLDSMLYHSGGFNNSDKPRRAINQVYTIPYIKQQICLPTVLDHLKLNAEEQSLIGSDLLIPNSVNEYLESR